MYNKKKSVGILMYIHYLLHIIKNNRVKIDVTPGRLNQTSFFINRSGLFYG